MNLAKAAAALRALAAALEEASPVIEREPDTEDLVGRPPSISVSTWRRCIRSGELPGKKVGRSYLVRKGDLAAWLETKCVEGRAEAPANDAHEELDEFDRIGRRHAMRKAIR